MTSVNERKKNWFSLNLITKHIQLKINGSGLYVLLLAIIISITLLGYKFMASAGFTEAVSHEDSKPKHHQHRRL